MNPNQLADEAARLAEHARELALNLTALAGTAEPVAGAVEPFIFLLAIFLMACFVGYYVVWNVTLGAAFAADGRHQRHQLGHRRRRHARHRARHQLLGDGLRLPRGDAGQREHLRRLPRHAPHAVHVQAPRQRRRCRRASGKG